jgi:hypothetical protein
MHNASLLSRSFSEAKPDDFMFELTPEEWTNLRSQFATSRWGGPRYAPFAFTEQGVAMLSSVLNTDRAIEVNISIMRAFVMMRQWALTHQELSKRLNALISLKETKTLEASKKPIPIRRLVEIKCIFV